jgi:hypothetical protein
VQQADNTGNWAPALHAHPALRNLRIRAPEEGPALVQEQGEQQQARQAAAWAQLPLGTCAQLSHVDLICCPLGATDALLRQLALCPQLRAVHVTAARLPGQKRQQWVSRSAGAGASNVPRLHHPPSLHSPLRPPPPLHPAC